MADSTVSDIGKMKVVDLRKELKARGLTHTGDKAELVARLQAAMMTPDDNDHGDITLDSDEIDSDSVLEDEDDKIHSDDGLDESAVELALADQPPAPPAPPTPPRPEHKPAKTLKRKFTDKPAENKEGGAKKIILNRAASFTITQPETTPSEPTKKPIESPPPDTKVTTKGDPKLKLESRAKRFGLPVKMSDDERKEARKMRFGQGAISTVNTPVTLAENVEKLKKRAERFGLSVSKVMTEIEERERLEKRKAKFGLVK